MLPAAITAGGGPRFGDDVWDVRGFVPRTTRMARVDFTCLADAGQRRTAREYLYSRLQRGIPANQLSGTARPMKLTGLYAEFWEIRTILTDLASAGAPRLADVTAGQLQEVLAAWKRHPDTAAGLVGVVKHLAAHGEFLTDRLAITPWPGRPASLVAGRRRPAENTTPRIPEHLTAPLITAAVFYVETAAADLLAAGAEIARLEQARAGRRLAPAAARTRLEAFIQTRRDAGRGIPALPRQALHKAPGALISDGVVQAPSGQMTGLLAGVHGTWYHRGLLCDAAAELGYEQGGLDTVMSPWPDTGMAWRARLDPWSLNAELTQLRTACWIVIAYLSGMRDAEVRELGRDCAVSEPGADGRIRHKLRGRVFKDRRLSGDEADWVVLGIVHQAVEVLLRANNDPAHLFGYAHGDGFQLLSNMSVRLSRFAAHADDLFGSPQAPFIPGSNDEHEAGRWSFTTMQFRRTLAWHIAHQPFGVVAGARQYKHAQVAVFEGYAGTSASGFAAEVEAEQATARLDYVRTALPGLAQRRAFRRRGRHGHQRRIRAHPGRARRASRQRRRQRTAAHDARPPHRHAAPRRARRLLLPARDGAVRQARPAARPPAAADAGHLPVLPERPPLLSAPAPPGAGPRTGPPAHRRDDGPAHAAPAARRAHRPPRPPRRAHHPDHRRHRKGAPVSIDEKIKAASGQLLAGRPQITDGRLTVANLCAEAGVSRASFYRSPHASAIRQALACAGSGAPDATPRPETEELREQLRQLAKTQTARRSQHAAEVRALRATVTTYANQIQLLALRVSQLQDHNQRLLRRLERAGDNVTALPVPSPAAQGTADR